MRCRPEAFVIILTLSLSILSFPTALCDSAEKVEVGIYYYPWYQQGRGNYHWNSSEEYPIWNVVDTPLLGYYSCKDENVIREQLEWMEDIGIDFIILSWWGNGNSPFGGVAMIDESCKFIFSVIQQYGYSIKAALMVESFNESEGVYDYQAIYDYVCNIYVVPYGNEYMRLNNSALLCFYNNDHSLTKNGVIGLDNRFQSRIVGHESYVDWWFAIPCSVNDSLVPPLSRNDGMICVEPRYDDQFLGRSISSTYDEFYEEGLYDDQWKEAIRLAREGKVNYVTIYSWNEYHERSQVEPHISMDGRYILSLLCKTKSYIDQIKSTEPIPLHSFFYVAVGIVTGVIPAWIYFMYKMRKIKKGV